MTTKPMFECLESRVLLDGTVWVVDGLDHVIRYSDGDPGGAALSVSDITGDDGDDVFVFANDAAVLTGTINGGGGNNVLHYGAYTNSAYGIATTGYTTAVNVDLRSNDASGIAGFLNIEGAVGGAGANTLIGPDSGTVWGITDQNSGSIGGGFTFGHFDNLTGGAGNDTFNLIDGAILTGSVNGQGGQNTLGIEDYTTGSSWSITGDNTGQLTTGSGTMSFDATQQLIGGQAADTFTFADQAKVQSVDGQGGDDTLNLQAYTTMFQIVLTDANRGDGQGMLDYPIPSNYVMDFQSIQTIQDNTQVLGQFGRIDGRRNVKLTEQDSNGTPVTFMLTGPGVGTVLAGPTFWKVELTGTTGSSKLIITTPKGKTTTLYGITVDGSLNSVTAKTTNLAGEINVSGSLRSATMANTSAGAEVNVQGESAVSSLTFGRVHDMSVTLAGGLKKFTATEFLDTDAYNDRITADWINELVTRGARDNSRTEADESSAGNFQADLHLSGESASRYTLGNARIAGSLTDSDWNIDGRLGSVRSSVGVTNWALDELSAGLTGVNTLNLGDVQSAFVTVSGGIGNVTTKRWLNGTIDAQSIKTLKTTGQKAKKGVGEFSGDFQATVNLNGSANPNAWTVTSALVSGDWNNSQWNVTGNVKSFRVRGTAQSSRLQTTGDIRQLTLGATDGSDFLAGVNKLLAGRFSDNRRDFAHASARIGSVKITGIKGAVPAMPLVTDSQFTAGGFGGVNFINAEFENVGIHVLDGEKNIKYIRHVDKIDRTNNWTWKPGRVPANFTTEPLISDIA